MTKKKIGILGSGLVAQVLGSGFIKHGYEVTFGTRDAGKLKEWLTLNNSSARVVSFEEAAKSGEIVVLAVKGSVVTSLIKQLAPHLEGKTVIDPTNPISDAPPANGVLQFTTGLNQSLMEDLQRAAPQAHLVKAFSCVGSHLMVNPQLPGGKPTMFIAGNSEVAKREVITILDQFGWDIADMGKAEGARAIEPLCILWCIPGFIRNEWTHALKLLKA
jgi:8-hydroxy-5-deazaflavin:NADPH oxidoreductase